MYTSAVFHIEIELLGRKATFRNLRRTSHTRVGAGLYCRMTFSDVALIGKVISFRRGMKLKL